MLPTAIISNYINLDRSVLTTGVKNNICLNMKQLLTDLMIQIDLTGQIY